MNTWSTISALSSVKISQTAFILETLNNEANAKIIEHLIQQTEASFIDLVIAINLDSDLVRESLATLEKVGFVVKEESYFNALYSLNEEPLSKVLSSVKNAFKLIENNICLDI